MKTKYTKYRMIILIIVFLISGKVLFAEFEILSLDNPAPGYLRFAWNSTTEFFLIDNSGNSIYEQLTAGSSNHYILLKDGNWAQKDGEKYIIYNQNLQKIDTILNPTISWNNACQLEWHAFLKLNNGHYLMLLTQHQTMDLSSIVEGGQTEALIHYNVIIETDRTGTIYWQWNALDHYDILDVTDNIDLTQAVIDMTHMNSFQEDTDGNIVVSVRHYDEISKISKSTGNFLWRFGGSKCKNNQFTILNDDQNGFKGFSHQHSIEILENGNLLMYDNGNLKNPQVSRAVEYQMDFANKKATMVWEARYNPGIFQAAMGSVQRLPNGNTLVNWGTSLVTEYKPNNQIAFDLKYSEYGKKSIYSAYRVVTKMEAGSNIVENSGMYDYNYEKTGVKINFTNISGQGFTSIEKHYYSPTNISFTDSTFSTLIPLRWVFSKNGINALNGTLYLDVSKLSGINDPRKAAIFWRAKEGEGPFSEINTDYNVITNELEAQISSSGEFIIGVSELLKPTLLSPQNNVSTLIRGILIWSEVQGAAHYQIQLSKNLEFSQFVFNKYEQNKKSLIYDNLEYLTDYYWRVRALNSKDTSEWSNTFKFRTNLPTPVLTLPLNSSIGFKLNDSLKWGTVPTAEQYRFQMCLNNNFKELVYDDLLEGTTSIQPKMLRNNTIYYWRVIALSHELTSEWSEIWSFRTILETPTLISPKSDSLNLPLNFKLMWTNISGATNYIVQLSKDSAFKEISKTSIIEINQFNIGGLDYAKKYFWRVRAFKLMDSSEWSNVFHFCTKLKSPIPVSPENQIVNVPLNCNLNWEDDNLDPEFTCQISKSVDFKSEMKEFTKISAKTLLVNELQPNTKYFWRIKANVDTKESDWSAIWSFNSSKGSTLLSPKLISPKNNSDVYIKGIISWLNVDGARKFKVQIAKNSTFSQIVKDTLVEVLYYQFFKLTTESKYFWRVKAYSYSDSSDWTNVWSFNVSKQAEIIHLISPLNDEMQVPLNGRLIWDAMPGAINYDIQLSRNPSFDENILNIKGFTNSNIEYSNLQLNKTYYWRVRFLREYDTSSWSQVWSFNTSTSSILAIPKLLSPADGAVPVELEGDIQWEHAINADRYSVQISTSPTFDSIFFKTIVNMAHEVHFSNLSYNTQYYWRIAAINDSSKSYWSHTSSFTTLLETPEIVYPSDNAVSLPTSIEFLWKVTEDVSAYTLQIAADVEFKNILHDISSIYSMGYNLNLDFKTTYYCRVKAVSDKNSSHWSTAISFTTYDPNSILNCELASASIFPNPVNSKISVKLNNLNLEQGIIVKYKIVKIDGQMIIEATFTNDNSNSLNVEFLDPGVYFLIIENSNYRKYLKFIKN